jgi:hypothetical protein
MEIQQHNPHGGLGVLPFPATPEIDGLLNFDQLYLSSALTGSKIPVHTSLVYLQDNLAAPGYLAFIAAMKLRCSFDPLTLKTMLDLKAEAMLLLRQEVHQTAPSRLARAVMSLLYTEVACQNTEAAAVHANLLETINYRHGLEADDLISLLYLDIQHSTMYLAPPLFKMDRITWDIFEIEYAPTRRPKTDFYEELGWPSRRLLIEMRQAFIALDLMRTPSLPQNMRRAAVVKFLHIMTLVLRAYNSSSDHVEQYTALAVLFRLRREAKMEQIPLGATTIFDAGTVIISRLRELLMSSQNDPPNLRTWVLAIGATSGDVWFKDRYERELNNFDPGSPIDLKCILDFYGHRNSERQDGVEGPSGIR